MVRSTRAPRRPQLRRFSLHVERLEVREVLSAAPVAGLTVSPFFEVSPHGSTAPPTSAKTPAQIRTAYGFNGITFNGVVGDGTGQTIAIVDAYDDPNIQADLNTFSTAFGLPLTTITKVNQNGGTTYPATDAPGGWATEIALDVEWAHAIAPGAKILLVEANSAYDSDLLAAVDYAAAHASVVSMSWGGGEFSGQTNYDGHFSKPGVTFVASSGDYGAPISWPAASANVLSVGGTSLSLGSGSVYAGESGWSGSGGGPSAYVAQPSYQAGVVTQTSTRRANPDVAYDADPNTGFAVYDSFGSTSTANWIQIGGTSAGAPQWAALLAIADQGRALNGLPALGATSPTEVMTTLYKNATTGVFHDVTAGTSTGSPNYSAAVGYDYVTGLGSPKANLVIPALVGTAAAAPDHLVVSAPATAVAGASFSVTVTAQTSGNATDTAYGGTVKFTSTDALAGLPASYTFTTADRGVHTFTVTLKTAGSQTVTATDIATAATTGTTSAITVSPATTASSLWSSSTTPYEDSYASGRYELGVKFRSDVAGSVTGVRFYKQSWMGGVTHVGHLWSSTGTLLASAVFTGETASGWQSVKFSTPVAIAANTTYVVSFSTGGGYFGITSNGFSSSGVDSGSLHAPSNAVAGGNGVYGYSGSFPSTSGNGMNFWADLTFSAGTTSALAKPATSSTRPAALTPTEVLPGTPTPRTISLSTPRASGTRVSINPWSHRRGITPAQSLHRDHSMLK